MNQKSLFAAALVVMVVVFAGATLIYRSSSGGAGPASDARMVSLDRAHAPSVGEADAEVVIVEFLDPACETCAIFYPAVKDVMAANPGQIRLVLRWAPFHEGSQGVVALLEAARLQGQFWPALERLLANQSRWAINHVADVNLAWQQLGGLELDRDKIIEDMGSPEIQQIIQQDMADATANNVQATPEYFVNGRPLPSFGWDQLMGLIDEELGR